MNLAKPPAGLFRAFIWFWWVAVVVTLVILGVLVNFFPGLRFVNV